MQGFQFVAEYHIQGEPDGRIVNDLRYRNHRLRNLPLDPMLREHEEVSAGSSRAQSLRAYARDQVQTLAPWAYSRKVRRNPYPVLVPGLKGVVR